jgi:hypothetical protein
MKTNTSSPWQLAGGGVIRGVGVDDRSVVATTHGLIEDGDSERVLPVVVEDEEVPVPNLCNAPPLD